VSGWITTSRVLSTVWYISAQLNSAFHPSGVGKSYWLGLRWDAFTCVRWQVTPCDPMWQVKPRSSVMGLISWTAIRSFNLISSFLVALFPALSYSSRAHTKSQFHATYNILTSCCPKQCWDHGKHWLTSVSGLSACSQHRRATDHVCTNIYTVSGKKESTALYA